MVLCVNVIYPESTMSLETVAVSKSFVQVKSFSIIINLHKWLHDLKLVRHCSLCDP